MRDIRTDQPIGEETGRQQPLLMDPESLRGRLRKSVRNESSRFCAKLDGAQRSEMVDALELLVRDGHYRPLALNCALDILRRYRGAGVASFARRSVLDSPSDYMLRYRLSNTLFLSPDRIEQLEAMKQRVIGCSRHVRQELRHGAPSDIARAIVEEHLGRIVDIEDFLGGKRPSPSKRVSKLSSVLQATPELNPLLSRLERLADLAGLPQLPITTTSVTAVLDSNAFSNLNFAHHLTDPRVRFVTPPDILLELSRWEAVERVPWELDAVEIHDPGASNPPEIEALYSPRKGAAPSEADKRVATLAWKLRARVIVSDDKDLWDSGLEERMLRSYAYRVNVISPSQFGPWLDRYLDTLRPEP
jgi:hypothetical protein